MDEERSWWLVVTSRRVRMCGLYGEAVSAKPGPPVLPFPTPSSISKYCPKQYGAQRDLIANDRYNHCCYIGHIGIYGIEHESSINTTGELERALRKTCTFKVPFKRHMYPQIL